MIEAITPGSSYQDSLASRAVSTSSSFATHLEDNASQFLRSVAVGDEVSNLAQMRMGGRPVGRFIELHPVVTKMYFVCHIFSIWSCITAIPKLYKHGRRFIIKTGMERFDAAMKIFAKLGDLSVSLATVAIGLEAFKIGEKLGRWGRTAFKVMKSWLNVFVLVGTVFSAAEVAIDVRRWWRTRKFQSEMTKQAWYRPDGQYSAKEYGHFKEYLNKMSADQEKILGKVLGVDGASFRKAALARMTPWEPSGVDLTRLKDVIEKMTGQLQTGKTLHLITAITDAVALVATGCLLIPVLHPLAAVLFVATTVSTLATTLFGQIEQYKFEEHLGMIERPEKSKPTAKMNWHERAVDFTKWQVGWYEEKSVIKRLVNAGSNIWENGLLAGEVLSSIFKVITTFGSIFK